AFMAALPASVSKILSASALSQFSDPNKLMSPVQSSGPHLPQTPQMAEIYQQILGAMRQGLSQGIHQIFVLCLIIMAAGLVSVFFLKEIKLSDRKKGPATGEVAAEETAEIMGMF